MSNAKHIFLSSEDKFRLVLNIKNNFSLDCLETNFLFNKSIGYSNLNLIQNLYTQSLFSLWNLAILSFVETNISKFSFFYRPYRSVFNFIFSIKNYFLRRYSKHSFYTYLHFRQSFNSNSYSWIIKSFPNKNQYLLSWLANRENVSLILLNSDLFFSFFNYLFINLV